MKFAPLPVPFRVSAMGVKLYNEQQLCQFAVDSFYAGDFMLLLEKMVNVNIPAPSWGDNYTECQMKKYAEDFHTANQSAKIRKPTVFSDTVH